MIDNDYLNFVKRMGSFEDTINLDDEDNLEDNEDNLDDEKSSLKHYGILGMRWGHHKINREIVARASKTGQDAAKLGQNVTKNYHNRTVLKEAKHLTDSQLKDLTNRLNLENNYVNAKTQQIGKTSLDSVLGTVGGILATGTSAVALYSAMKKVNG